MNPNVPGFSEQSVYKDAIFFSMHKFVGGVQTPGVLVAKKSLFNNTTPNGCGGGTVFFVTQSGHRYLKDTEMREEGGTGAIVESVRAGLVMQLKEAVGSQNIMAREEKICKMVLAHIRTIPELILLGNNSPSITRLPVFSFMVRHPRGTFLHHNFVCAVLNDVFGIQVRGGCACAGPYAQDLLGISEILAADYEAVLMEDSRLDRSHLRRRGEHSSYEMLRPGFARVSIPFFMSDAEIAYVLEALKMVATEGWKLLPQYILNPETGEWRHNTNTVFRDRKWLGSIRYVDGKMQTFERRVSGQTPCPHDTGDCLHTARNIFNKARKMAQRYPLPDQRLMFDDNTAALRWFMLPSEAQDLLLGNVQNVKQEVPFDPAPYSGARGRTSSCDSISSGDTTPTVQQTSPVRISCAPSNLSTSLARHNSLSSIETLPRFSGSPTAPIQSRMRINSLQVPPQWVPTQPESVGPLSPQSPLCFCIGDPVQPNSPPLGINTEYFSSLARMRCNSLGSPLSCSDANAPISSVQSSCSCGSQIDLNSIDKDFHSLPPYSSQLSVSFDGSVTSNSSPHPDGLQAYVQEVTKELATEIKSEIREVISQVEDVLSDSTDISSTNSSVERLQNSRMRCDSVSAEHVAEYLADKGKDLISEMKTEIRGMVDGLISPDKTPMVSPLVKEIPGKLELKSVKCLITDPSPDKTVSEDSSEETVVHTIMGKGLSESKDDSENDEDFDTTESLTDGMRQLNLDEVKSLDTRVNSISSQDSGINMLCSESDSKAGSKQKKNNGKDCIPCQKKSVSKREEPKEVCSEDDSDATKPECSPCTSESENDSKGRDHCFSCTKNCTSGKTCPKITKKKSVIRVDVSKNASSEDGGEKQICSAPKKRSVCASGSGSAFTCAKDDDDVVKKACALRRSSRAGISEAENINKKPVSAERLRSKGGWHCPPKNIWKPTMEAIDEFTMIRDGDKVMVCLSGGKDSLSLLHTLRQYQFYARTKGINFTLGAATVDPGSTAYDPKPLIPYLASLGVHYMYEEQSILDQAANLENGCTSVCSFCSRMKRGRLYAAARANGYNVLALGQHLDDLAESFLMSTFHNGRMRTMKAHYYIKERDLRVIRPFVYVREKALRQFAESKALPIIAENCPACFEAPKERHRTKQLLAQQEILFPRIFWSLRSALHPLLSFRYTGQESAAYNKNKRRSSIGIDPPGRAPPHDGSDTEEEPIC